MSDTYFSQIRDQGTPPLYKNLIGGEWVSPSSQQTIDGISPIDHSLVGRVPVAGEAEINRAYEVAKQSQPAWAAVPRTKRAQILQQGAAVLRERSSELIDLLIMEIGKSRPEATDEVLRSADMIDAFAQASLTIRGESLTGDGFPGYDQSKVALVEPVPLGVVLAIAPFNYPINLSVAKIAPALAMGNAVVIKPPMQGALSCLCMVACLQEAGLPLGIMSALTGEGRVMGKMLVEHPAVEMIAFTGSSPVGNSIARQAGMIPLLFECGGNNAALVLPDADIEATATEIVKGAFSYSGQRCTAINYVVCQRETVKKLLPHVIEITKKTMVIGDPRKKGVTFGPLISEAAAKDIESRIRQAVTEGAKIALGGKRTGNMIDPTILTEVAASFDIVKHEAFGPVVSFLTVSSIEEMVAIVNGSYYGLQASIFTQDEGTGIAVGRKLHVGSVQINSRPQRGPDHFPFVGVKHSGVGVQGISYTLQMMTRPHVLVLTKPQ